MLKAYYTEALTVITVGLMLVYPPACGVAVLFIVAGLYGTLKFILIKESPDLAKLKDEMKDVKQKLEAIILRGNR